jgi:DNA-binding MarR family transcriptional regulator
MYMNKDIERHIGYWLKHVDRLIEDAAERTFTEEGITRRHWQVLNVLRKSPRDTATLTEALAPFWGPDAIGLTEVTADLTARGWLTETDGRYQLTESGEAAHTTVEKKVQAIRETSQTGLTADDYHQTVHTLRRMAANLTP